MAHNGRFGPYLKKGSDTRSLDTEEQLLTVTLDEALALFAQPKTPGWAHAGAAPRAGRRSRHRAAHGGARTGRFGPYVTDGTTNASLRKGDDVEAITMERAAELLAERRAAGPSTRKKAAKKKAPAKKTGARKTAAKKTAAKKTAAKRSPAKKKARPRPRPGQLDAADKAGPALSTAGSSDEDPPSR